jgi:hypothetical protein
VLGRAQILFHLDGTSAERWRDANKEMITTQLYFPKELNTRMFTTVDPYKKRGVSPTTNANDMIAGAHPSVLTIT